MEIMSHSNRKKLNIVLIAGEVLVFASSLVASYLLTNSNFLWFFVLLAVACALFLILRLLEANPTLKEIAIHEDLAGQIASGAIQSGVSQYFDMQRHADQDRRNVQTQTDVGEAAIMWLCANSGASYLDPGVYRHWSSIEKKLRNRTVFRVVLLDPCSDEKILRNHLNVGGESIDSKLNLASLIKLYNTYPTLEIRFVQDGMHATVFATDKALYFDPYHVGVVNDRIENRSYCMRILPKEPLEGIGLYKLFKCHVDTLWDHGCSFEAWVDENGEKFSLNLPELKRR